MFPCSLPVCAAPGPAPRPLAFGKSRINQAPRQLLFQAADALKVTKMELKPCLLRALSLWETKRGAAGLFVAWSGLLTISRSPLPRPATRPWSRAGQGPSPARPWSQFTGEANHDDSSPQKAMHACAHHGAKCCEKGKLRPSDANKMLQAASPRSSLATPCSEGALPS